jgi:undecaprenyl diphosphate synthase
MPLHVGVIMDGNGRWATARGWPRVAGHREGARAVRRVVRAVLESAVPIDTLTLYAFSADNWQRPAAEVGTLMGLFEQFLQQEAARAAREGIRVSIIGRRDRLASSLVEAIDRIEPATAAGRRLHVRIAVDYSGRDAIWRAACHTAAGKCASREQFASRVASGRGETADARDVDLLIRTGGEQRLSDFLLWECAYAELYFTATMWPDFQAADLAEALASFRARDRRFGRLRAG